MTYHAWARRGKRWELIAVGSSAAEAYRALLAWIGQQPRPPVASAVLPAGTHPAAQAERLDTPAGPDGPQAAGTGPRPPAKDERGVS